jgi:hypothetical protein
MQQGNLLNEAETRKRRLGAKLYGTCATLNQKWVESYYDLRHAGMHMTVHKFHYTVCHVKRTSMNKMRTVSVISVAWTGERTHAEDK